MDECREIWAPRSPSSINLGREQGDFTVHRFHSSQANSTVRKARPEVAPPRIEMRYVPGNENSARKALVDG